MPQTTIMASETLINRVAEHVKKSGDSLKEFYTRAIVNQLEKEGDWDIRDMLEMEGEE